MKERGGNPFKKVYEYVRCLWVHNREPAMLDYARKELLEQWNVVQKLKQLEVVTDERLEEIRNDEELQSRYRHLLHEKRSLNKQRSDLAQLQLERLPIDMMSGFIIHKIEFYEKRYNIKLISREED